MVALLRWFLFCDGSREASRLHGQRLSSHRTWGCRLLLPPRWLGQAKASAAPRFVTRAGSHARVACAGRQIAALTIQPLLLQGMGLAGERRLSRLDRTRAISALMGAPRTPVEPSRRRQVRWAGLMIYAYAGGPYRATSSPCAGLLQQRPLSGTSSQAFSMLGIATRCADSCVAVDELSPTAGVTCSPGPAPFSNCCLRPIRPCGQRGGECAESAYVVSNSMPAAHSQQCSRPPQRGDLLSRPQQQR